MTDNEWETFFQLLIKVANPRPEMTWRQRLDQLYVEAENNGQEAQRALDEFIWRVRAPLKDIDSV